MCKDFVGLEQGVSATEGRYWIFAVGDSTNSWMSHDLLGFYAI